MRCQIILAMVFYVEANDCVMSPWTEWSACSEDCDCGLQQRSRDVITKPTADGEECPYNSEAQTCNCEDCDKVKAANPKKHLVLPASSAHGFTPSNYKPDGGFPTDVGEQAACVLDKAEAVVDVVPEMLNCKEWHHEIGEPCYALPIEHLVKHTEACCEGREHFVLWDSDTLCEKNIAQFVHHLKSWAAPIFDKCALHGDASACTQLKTKNTYNHFATLLEQGIAAAKALYAKGKPGDLTEAAKAFTEVTRPLPRALTGMPHTFTCAN